MNDVPNQDDDGSQSFDIVDMEIEYTDDNGQEQKIEHLEEGGGTLSHKASIIGTVASSHHEEEKISPLASPVFSSVDPEELIVSDLASSQNDGSSSSSVPSNAMDTGEHWKAKSDANNNLLETSIAEKPLEGKFSGIEEERGASGNDEDQDIEPRLAVADGKLVYSNDNQHLQETGRGDEDEVTIGLDTTEGQTILGSISSNHPEKGRKSSVSSPVLSVDPEELTISDLAGFSSSSQRNEAVSDVPNEITTTGGTKQKSKSKNKMPLVETVTEEKALEEGFSVLGEESTIAHEDEEEDMKPNEIDFPTQMPPTSPTACGVNAGRKFLGFAAVFALLTIAAYTLFHSLNGHLKLPIVTSKMLANVASLKEDTDLVDPLLASMDDSCSSRVRHDHSFLVQGPCDEFKPSRAPFPPVDNDGPTDSIGTVDREEDAPFETPVASAIPHDGSDPSSAPHHDPDPSFASLDSSDPSQDLHFDREDSSNDEDHMGANNCGKVAKSTTPKAPVCSDGLERGHYGNEIMAILLAFLGIVAVGSRRVQGRGPTKFTAVATLPRTCEDVCLILARCNDALRRNGRRSSSRDIVQHHFDLSAYVCLTKEDLREVCKQLGAKYSAKCSKAGISANLANHYEAILEGLTIPHLKKILSEKSIKVPKQVRKGDLVRLVVEAGF